MDIVHILHGIGTIIGFGGAIYAAGLMLRLNTDEQRLCRGRLARRIAPITWLGFAVLIITGVLLTVQYSSEHVLLLRVKHICVVILLGDALVIHFRLFPRYFRQIGTPDFKKIYTTMCRVGALSVTCWIIVLVLSIWAMLL